MKCKKVKFIETDREVGVARGWGLVEMGEILVQGYKTYM